MMPRPVSRIVSAVMAPMVDMTRTEKADTKPTVMALVVTIRTVAARVGMIRMEKEEMADMADTEKVAMNHTDMEVEAMVQIKVTEKEVTPRLVMERVVTMEREDMIPMVTERGVTVQPGIHKVDMIRMERVKEAMVKIRMDMVRLDTQAAIARMVKAERNHMDMEHSQDMPAMESKKLMEAKALVMVVTAPAMAAMD